LEEVQLDSVSLPTEKTRGHHCWLIGRRAILLTSLRRLTRSEWVWYAGFPLAFVAALVLGLLIGGWNNQVFVNVSPFLVAAPFFAVIAGWWVIHMAGPVSARATNLAVSGLFASIVFEVASYALSINRGFLFFVFEAFVTVCFVPGFFCTIYYLGIGEPTSPLMARGQKMIVGGIFSFIYVGIGSRSVVNIGVGVFHADLLPQLWLWLGRIGLEGGVLLMGVGVLITRKGWSLIVPKDEDEHKQTWGKWLQGLTFLLTLTGVFLSGYSITVLGGLIAIVVGLLFYPLGWLIDALSKPKASGT
jgi:hypothetical protein